MRSPTTISAIAALAATASMALTACTEPEEEATPGVTADTVTIGTHQPLTGPAAAGYAAVSAATSAYFEYVNANGGVNGRTIEYLVKDDSYDPTADAVDVNGVAWLLEEESDGIRFTTTERTMFVEVTVPDDYAPEVNPLTDLAAAVDEHIPADPLYADPSSTWTRAVMLRPACRRPGRRCRRNRR